MRKTTMISLATTLLFSAQAFAQEAHAAAGGDNKGLYALGLALMLGLGAFGATSGQGRVGAAAMEGMARNPQASKAMFVPMLIVLALIESLFILTWLVTFTKI